MTGARIRVSLGLRLHRATAFVRARLSPDGAYGLHLTIGAVVLTGAAWLFGGIAEDLITRDPLVEVDAMISEWLRVHASPRFAALMHAVSALASTPAVTLLAIVLGCALLWQRRWYWLLGVVLAVPGGVLLNFVLKQVFGRARPGWADASMALDDPGFPSGHTMMVTIIYGLLAVYLMPAIAAWRWRFVVAALAAAIILAVALSRVVLGAHYLSDVLGAMAAGFARVAGVAMAAGVGYTVFSEWLNTAVRGSWAYADAMPIVPWLGIGLAPLLQWIVVPCVAFWLVRRQFGTA